VIVFHLEFPSDPARYYHFCQYILYSFISAKHIIIQYHCTEEKIAGLVKFTEDKQ